MMTFVPSYPVHPIVAEIGRSIIARSSREQVPRKSVIPAEVDSRFRGNDDPKTAVGACGLSSLAVNRTENPMFCAVNVRMGRHFIQLTGPAKAETGSK